MRAALGLCLLLAGLLAARAAGPAALQHPAEQQQLFSATPHPQQRCAPEVPLPEGLSLTAAERELLQYICWPPEGLQAGEGGGGVAAPPLLRRGVPAGVNCTVTQWCDGSDVCTEVCTRGSVQVEPWLAHAIRQQSRLVQTLPLCWASLLGTHNSAITLADGYGNLDEYFRGFFKYIKWAVKDFSDAPLQTNDQLVSLTDQLNLGVRSLELDTHWVRAKRPAELVWLALVLLGRSFRPWQLECLAGYVARMPWPALGLLIAHPPQPHPCLFNPSRFLRPGGRHPTHCALRRPARAAAEQDCGRAQLHCQAAAPPHPVGHRDAGLRALPLLHPIHGAAPAHRRIPGDQSVDGPP
jgi:hypothetical protein